MKSILTVTLNAQSFKAKGSTLKALLSDVELEGDDVQYEFDENAFKSLMGF